MAEKFYGSVNGQAEEALKVYGAVHTLTACTGSVVSGGAGNVTAFSSSTFMNRLSTPASSTVWAPAEVIEGDKQLVSIAVKLLNIMGSGWYLAFLRFADGSEESIQMYDNGTLTDHLTDTELYNWGIVAVPVGQGVGDWDYINLTPTYSAYHSKEILKIYGSVNGQTELIYRKMWGKVVYYTDSGNTQTATVRMYDPNDINQLSNSNTSWTATIGGVTIANDKIKEVYIDAPTTNIPIHFCGNCTELTTVSLPNSITYIGQYFLDNCHKFNSPLNLSNVTFIGSYFMHECDDFNQTLTIPSSVTSIGTYFMYRCNSFVQPLIVDCPATVISYDDHSLSTLVMSVDAYRTGHTLAGTYAQDWKDKFPNRAMVPYRKLSVDGTRTWGEVYYYDSIDSTYSVVPDDTGITINSVNQSTLESFITTNHIAINETIEIALSIVASGKKWKFPVDPQYGSSTVDVTFANLASTTGIDASVTGSIGTKNAHIELVVTPSPSANIVSAVLLNNTEYGGLGGSSMPKASFTVGGQTIVSQAVEGFRFNGLESSYGMPTYFLNGCKNLTWVDMTSYTNTPVADYFLYNCSSLNNLINCNVSNYGDYFLAGCSSFNQPVTIPNGITKIGAGFLYGCALFDQLITIPSSVTEIGMDFLRGCSSFNQPMSVPSSVTEIGIYFLSHCTSFNSSVTFASSDFKTIPNYFMYYCSSFNKSLPFLSQVTTIGSHFMGYCSSFNSTIDVSSATSIGSYFLERCATFNQPVSLPNTITAIPMCFMYYCLAFNSTLTLPNSFTSIGSYFMYHCEAFNQPISLPNTFTTIDNYFLNGCTGFNQTITIPSSVTTIGTYFLYNCVNFNKNLTIPSNVTSIAAYFMQNCHMMTSTVIANANPSFANITTYTLATTDSSAPCYTTGVYLGGTYKNEWHTKFPDRTSSPYRKTIVV